MPHSDLSPTAPAIRALAHLDQSYYSFLIPLRIGGRVGLNTQQLSNLLKVACDAKC